MVTRVRALALLNSPFASLPHSFFCQWLLPVLPTNNPQICPPPSSIAATDRDAARPGPDHSDTRLPPDAPQSVDTKPPARHG